MTRNEEQNTVIKYVIAAVLFVLIAFGCMLKAQIFTLTSAKEIFNALSNALTIPAVLYLAIGIFSKLTQWGAYDMLGFAFSHFSLHNLIPTKNEKKPKAKSFYDYHLEKEENRKGWLPHIFFIGLIGMGLAFVFVALYYFV